MKRYLFLTGLLLTALAFGINAALAAPKAEATPQASGLHPDFALLDANGTNVLESNGAISTMNTCGQ